uniref:Uncharacterized protein n=1 Tax=Ixodes ricinus TaxID=34613 RepID=A0A6B0U164_IXORI
MRRLRDVCHLFRLSACVFFTVTLCLSVPRGSVVSGGLSIHNHLIFFFSFLGLFIYVIFLYLFQSNWAFSQSK